MIHPYATELYASALTHWGRAVRVPQWGCSVIAREVPGGEDAAGPYPIAVLSRDADIAGGLEHLRRLGMISVTLVLDEFHRPPIDALAAVFQCLNPFKTHYIRRNTAGFDYGRHHRYEVRRASSRVEVRQFDMTIHLEEWCGLYADLKQRHRLAGVHDFAKEQFAAMARVPGMAAIGGWIDGQLVSAHLWISDGSYVHSHLAASNEAGYAAGAAYAVYDASIRHFGDAELLNFGGGAGAGLGANAAADDGLARFKRGFANESVPAYLCGAILDPARYENLVRQSGVSPDTLFFPAYRLRTP